MSKPLSFHVCPEIGEQLLGGREFVSLLFLADMPVIAFAGFIVVAQHALSFDDERQAIPEPVR
jgi:hypothetical protein